MDLILSGLASAAAPTTLLYTLIGVVTGILVGAIPGLTGAMLITLTLPLTYYMDSSSALTMLVAMYVGSVSGGLITATLFRIPGTPASVVTTLDGYPMSKNGQPGKALGLGILASFVGGLISWVFLVTMSPPLAILALKFSYYEYFSMVFMALVLIATISQGSMLKGLLSGMLGILVALPGLDPTTGQLRLTFGFPEMSAGFSLLPVLIGIFAVGQILAETLSIKEPVERLDVKLGGIIPSWADVKTHFVNLVRSSVIGTWIGILPGVGANIGSIVSYSAAKSASATPEEFGNGSPEGIISSEAANNATIGGALIPLITLGIPGSLIDAILLGALVLHNFQPGPLLFQTQPDLVYGIMGTALIANIFMFVFMCLAASWISKLVQVPAPVLTPVILLFCVIGAYALSNRVFDIWVMLGFGVVGFAFDRLKVPIAPFIIGLVLAPIAEGSLRSGLMSSAGSIEPFFTRPMSLTFLLLSVGMLVWPLIQRRLRLRKSA